MMAVIDAYDAMTNDRIYAKKITGHQALNRIIAGAGSHFDPQYAHKFLSISGAYPNGSVVKLNSGEIGVVTSQNPGSIVSPNLELFFTPARKPLPRPRAINLADDSTRFIEGELCSL
jgi:HD-GYP domain-containing protein (c-di-GMP phosphodiesterase class II)